MEAGTEWGRGKTGGRTFQDLCIILFRRLLEIDFKQAS